MNGGQYTIGISILQYTKNAPTHRYHYLHRSGQCQKRNPPPPGRRVRAQANFPWPGAYLKNIYFKFPEIDMQLFLLSSLLPVLSVGRIVHVEYGAGELAKPQSRPGCSSARSRAGPIPRGVAGHLTQSLPHRFSYQVLIQTILFRV